MGAEADPAMQPLRPPPEPEPQPRALGEEEARRALRWLRWHFRVAIALLAIAGLVLAFEAMDYGGPLWPVVGLSLIAATLGSIGTVVLASRVSDPVARGSALVGAGLLTATCAGYIYLVTVGTLNLELSKVPLHTLGLLLLGALVSLAMHLRALGQLTGGPVPTATTFVLAGVLSAAVGAELLGVVPEVPYLSVAFLLPLTSHVVSVGTARRALRRFVDSAGEDAGAV